MAAPSWWVTLVPYGRIALWLCILMVAQIAEAAREVKFPPPDSKAPPPLKSPPRTQSSGEDTAILPDAGPTQRKTQEREVPPPTTLTIMYKLQYGEKLKYVYPDGRVQEFEQWESYKSDGYNLTKSTNERLADGNNYMYAVKPLASPGFDPVDIPLLYMTGDYDFVFSPAEVQNLRRFIRDGGTIIFNAARGLDEFSLAVAREMRRVLPQKTFMKLPLDHPVFNARYRVEEVSMMVSGVQFTQPPELYSIDIGTRAAAILVPGGMGAAWSGEEYHPAGKHILGESAVRLGVNLVSYVLGSTEYGRFLAQQFPVYDGSTREGDVLRFAALRYAGSWDVNPALQNSLMQAVRDNTNIDVDFRPHAVDLEDPQIGQFPLVFLTGHYDFVWTKAQTDNLRNYLERGGVLVASSAGGLKPFDIALRRELKKALPSSDLVKLPPSHPLFTSSWNSVTRVRYTPALLRDRPAFEDPEFYGCFLEDRLAVLYTPYDLTGPLNRESNAYSKGLTPDDATKIAINIVSYVMSH